MNIGFLVLDVNVQNTKHEKILKSINELCKIRPYDNIVLFNNKFECVDLDHKYYILHVSQAKYFKGLLFIFDVRTAMLTKTFTTPSKQLFFVDKSDWGEKTDIPYTFWRDIYMNKNFEIIAENRTIYELCELCWKKPIAEISNFDTQGINDVIQKLQ